jgi:hypothetical protein
MGGISAGDMRVFVNAVFDTKENEIRVFDKLSELDDYRLSNPEYIISKDDLIVITDYSAVTDITERGLYLSTNDNPSSSQVTKIASRSYEDFLELGENGQLITIQDGSLKWIEPLEGYYIEGTAKIMEILVKRPVQRGPVWIAEDENLLAPVPGTVGDGYSWNGFEWVNVGQLRGPEGDIVQVAFASQFEVDGGYINNKGVSPKTLKDYYRWSTKENYLKNPSHDGDMVVSTITGVRSWETPVRKMEDLADVEYQTVQANSILVYDGLLWKNIDLANIVSRTFLSLQDTPNTYIGQQNKGLMVDGSEKNLIFTPLVKESRDLSDFDDRVPMEDQILIYKSGKWTPSANTVAGTSSSRPQNPRTGEQFFDVSIGIPIWFNGNMWVNALGEAA